LWGTKSNFCFWHLNLGAMWKWYIKKAQQVME
jgi:hypothetical protein